MNLFSDQTGKFVSLPALPRRIVSIVPSQTELLYSLGLEEEVVGITKFCVHPEHWFRHKKRVGGTKNLNIDTIRKLQPDLVIANKEENRKEQVEAIETFCPVWTSDVKNLEDALQMIEQIAIITGTEEKGKHICKQTGNLFKAICTPSAPLRTAYLIWKEPYMSVGGDTFIHDMMKRAGLLNIFADELRYPTIDLNKIKEGQCKLVLLSSEPYPFKEKHIIELQHALPGTSIMLVNGEMFSWYGSRLLEAAGYLMSLQESLFLSNEPRTA